MIIFHLCPPSFEGDIGGEVKNAEPCIAWKKLKWQKQRYSYRTKLKGMAMDDFWIIVAVIDLICAQLIAQYIGTKRKIGYGKSVFWSVVLGPVIGLIIVLSSKRLEEEQTAQNK